MHRRKNQWVALPNADWCVLARFVCACVIGLASGFAIADSYRCTKPDGRIVYQQAPCNEGSRQHVIDDSKARAKREAEERWRQWQENDKKRQETEKAKYETELMQSLQHLHACMMKEVECGTASYRMSLQCMSAGEVRRVLGEPLRMQEVGGATYKYYDVPIEGGRSARLQVIFSYSCGKNGLPGSSFRVKDVNIF